jgi:hypothetical protein
MHTRFVSPFSKALPMPSMTKGVGYEGHETLESMSALPLLSLACGQKAQFALHLAFLNVIKYVVVGAASSLPLASPSTIAEPAETRICFGTCNMFFMTPTVFFHVKRYLRNCRSPAPN